MLVDIFSKLPAWQAGGHGLGRTGVGGGKAEFDAKLPRSGVGGGVAPLGGNAFESWVGKAPCWLYGWGWGHLGWDFVGGLGRDTAARHRKRSCQKPLFMRS